MKDVTIIIPTKSNIEYLQMAIDSIRSKPQYDTCRIIIGADNPSKEVKEWLDNNQMGKFDFKIYETPNGQVGIVGMVTDLVSMVKTKYCYYMHDDMTVGNKTIENLLRSWQPKRILSSYRIEPPIYPESPEKLLLDFGQTATTFKNDEFLKVEEQLLIKNKNVAVEGFFAPHLFAVEDWVGYDPVFAPTSREDSDLAQRFMQSGCKLYTVWDSIVYHFSGKGNRRKEGLTASNGRDTDNWKKANTKNEKNYIRKWKTLAHTEFILPLKAPDYKISATVLVGKEQELIYQFLENVEPYFDEFIFVFDKNNQDNSKQEIVRYMMVQKENAPTNFDESKFKFFERDLNGDFGAQTNYAIEQCSNDWTMKLDVDEQFPPEFLSKLRFVMKDVIQENPNICVFGFPRINLLDGKVSNDIPREHWFTDEFNKYPVRPDGVQNPDLQFRLHLKDVRWVNKVHELPEPVAKRDLDRIQIVQNLQFFHPKSRERQKKQEELYNKINSPITEVKNVVYDSVIYTVEGITEHARQEIKELKNQGMNIRLLDANYQEGFGDFLKDCYAPIDLRNDSYVTIVNQPPVRWGNNSHLKNRIGYLAFEGELNNEWVKIINESNIIELWTPSEYCKKMFLKSGVKKRVVVVPHAINPEVWEPRPVKNNRIKAIKDDNKFIFLGVGTFHNKRKGFDLLLKAFNQEFKGQDDVKLVLKINRIYNPNERFMNYARQFLDPTGNMNIEFIDDDLTEDEMVDLFNIADCYVTPHRAEGFGMNILNALAVGTPVITTNFSGNLDFCNKDNCELISVKKEIWSPWEYPYEKAKWVEPDINSLKRIMKKVHNNPEHFKSRAKKQSKIIRKKHTWNNVVTTMIALIQSLPLR